MAAISVNGQIHKGQTVEINQGKLLIDGRQIQADLSKSHITTQADIASICVDQLNTTNEANKPI